MRSSTGKSAPWIPTAAATSRTCCSGASGRHFYAFDLLAVNGCDLRAQPLLERKRLLLKVLPKIETRLLYLDHFVERGRDLYNLACERDLEGVVAKWVHGSYQSDARTTSWLKIRNAAYTQALGRRELFEARRDQRQRGYRTPELRLA